MQPSKIRPQAVPAPTWALALTLVAMSFGAVAHPGHPAESKITKPPIAADPVEPAVAPDGPGPGAQEPPPIAVNRPRDATGWVRLGDSLMRQHRLRPEGSPLLHAERAYRHAIDLAPNHAEALLGMAWVNSVDHDFDTARSWAEKALAIDPDLALAYALLGDGEVERGDYDQALVSYQQAIDRQPGLATYSRAAHLLWLTGDARRARWLMAKAIRAGSPRREDLAWCHAQLALMLWNDGSILPAGAQVERALALAPDDPEVLFAAARIEASRDRLDVAIDLLRRAIETRPMHDALALLVDLHTCGGDIASATEARERLIALHESGAAHHHGGAVHSHPPEQGNAQLARFYADHGLHPEEAVRQAENAYRSFPNVFTADTLAWCLLKAGRPTDALPVILEALRRGTPDASILFHAGMIHAALGEPAAAVGFLHRALSLNPRFHPREARLAETTLGELAASRLAAARLTDASSPPDRRAAHAAQPAGRD